MAHDVDDVLRLVKTSMENRRLADANEEAGCAKGRTVRVSFRIRADLWRLVRKYAGSDRGELSKLLHYALARAVCAPGNLAAPYPEGNPDARNARKRKLAR